MRITKISQGGQIQVPAEVRKRWGTRNVMIQDGGAYIRISPMPEDPIAAVMGSLAGPGPSVNEMMRQHRAEEAEIEERKWGYLDRKP